MKRHADLVLALASIACAALMVLRCFAVFRDGPFVSTSGSEEESLFAIWKWVHGERVFAPAFDPPFAISYFNWLFYWIYGVYSATISSFLKLGSSALPSAARSLTVLITLTSGILVYLLLEPLKPLRRIAGSIVIALNPLIGFWIVSARPDIGALACDLAGLWFVKKAGRSGPVWLIPALAAFYGAWAFKQTYISALAAACLYLFFAGRRNQAFLLGGGAAVAFGATLALGSASYRYSLLGSQSTLFLTVSLALHNFLLALVKAPLFALGLIFLLYSIRKVHLDPLALTALISFALMLPASAKWGAIDNYFFEPAAFCSIVFLLASSERWVFAGGLAQFVPMGLIFAGLAGALLTPQYPEWAFLKAKLAALPGPVIVTDRVGNLPWFQEKSPHFVWGSTYPFDRRRGKPFAFDGIAGMIRMGLIKVVVCPQTDVDKPFDGIVPASLHKIGEDSYWVYFETAAGR